MGWNPTSSSIIEGDAVSGKKQRRVCRQCGKEGERWNFKFCSNKCQRIYQTVTRYAEVDKSGTLPANKNNKFARGYLLYKHGHVCSICGRRNWQCRPVPLVVDHIDGNSENHSVDNVRLVCGNCDMQLPTYKGRNRGNGRHSRRERYRNGQSY